MNESEPGGVGAEYKGRVYASERERGNQCGGGREREREKVEESERGEHEARARREAASVGERTATRIHIARQQ